MTLPGNASPQWYWRAASLGKPQPHPDEIPQASAGANPALQCLQRTSQFPASELALSPRNDLGLDSGSSDQNPVDRVMRKSFPAGRARGRGPTPRAVYKKDAHGTSSAEGWQMSPVAAKMAPCSGGVESGRPVVPLGGLCKNNGDALRCRTR